MPRVGPGRARSCRRGNQGLAQLTTRCRRAKAGVKARAISGQGPGPAMAIGMGAVMVGGMRQTPCEFGGSDTVMQGGALQEGVDPGMRGRGRRRVG